MTSHRLKVLIVSPDRATLRGLSRFLEKFGYDPRPCTDPARAKAALEFEQPHLLIVDWDQTADECRELCQAAGGDRRREYVYTLLMIDQPEPRELHEAIQSGVDDFLSRPVIYGELLARLRAGARVLEYERRVRAQANLDPITGLLSQAGFLARLQQQRDAATPWACVLFHADDLSRVSHTHGDPLGGRLLEALAGQLEELGSPHEVLARLENGRFAALLKDTDETTAAGWAQAACETVRETEFPVDGPSKQITLRTTLTAGVAASEEDLPRPQTLLERAAEALQLAQRSGHDCVVCYSKCEEDQRRWNQLAEPGELFRETLARHVMTPGTITLRPEATTAKAASLFRQTALTAIAVVDLDGRLQGLLARPCDAELASWADDAEPQHVGSRMATDVARLKEDTPFAELMEHFQAAAADEVMIVEDDVPTGLITRQSLRLLVDPLATDTFAPRSPFVPTSDYLLVPDLCFGDV